MRGAEQKGKADDLENELFAFERMVSGSPELRDALSDPARSNDDKRRLLKDLLDGKATSATVRLAEQAVAGTHRTVAVALESYQKIAAEHRNRLVATVRVARELAAPRTRSACRTPWPGSTAARCTSTSSSTPTSSAGCGWPSVTTSSTAPSPAASTTPDDSSPADRRSPRQPQHERPKRAGMTK